MEIKVGRFKFLDILYYGIYSMIYKNKSYRIGQDHNRILIYFSLYISFLVIISMLFILHFTNYASKYISILKIIIVPIYIFFYFTVNKYFDENHYLAIIQKFENEIGRKKGRVIGIVSFVVFLFMAFGVPFILSKFK